MTQNSFRRTQRMCITSSAKMARPHAGCTRSECCTIFKLVTALIVKAMRNKKRRRRISIGPCTKPACTGKGFHFRVFHKTNEFSINDSFFRFFVRPVCHFGPLYRNERKGQSETKATPATTRHEKP